MTSTVWMWPYQRGSPADSLAAPGFPPAGSDRRAWPATSPASWVRREPVTSSPPTRDSSRSCCHGRRRDRHLPGWQAWIPADGLLMWRVCPQCLLAAAPPPYPYLLAWAIPIMLTCPIHDRWLEFYADPPGDYIRIPYRQPPPPNPAVTAMDTITWQAITTGHTTLPGGNVPARTWFRLLRTLIDEISAAPPEYGNAPTVTQQARGSGRPAPTEQHDRRPYEDQPPDAQDQILKAAATAIAALQAGTTTGRGDTAPLLQPRPPVASTTVCRQLLTRLQRTPENDTAGRTTARSPAGGKALVRFLRIFDCAS